MDFVQSRLSERSDSQLSLGSVLERICESVSTCSCIISVHDCVIMYLCVKKEFLSIMH